jgi:hypothetical protein
LEFFLKIVLQRRNKTTLLMGIILVLIADDIIKPTLDLSGTKANENRFEIGRYVN